MALLTPLSEARGVGVAELLRGERAERPLETAEVDALVSGALHLGREEELRMDRRKKWWKQSYLIIARAGLGAAGPGLWVGGAGGDGGAGGGPEPAFWRLAVLLRPGKFARVL